MPSFVETRLFIRLVRDYLTDDEYVRLQLALAADPEIGAVIPGSGGGRKMCWRAAGRGKRGGVRVICFLRRREGEIWMLTLYAKNVMETIPAAMLKRIREEIEDEGDHES